MKNLSVRSLMVPLEEYAVINENTSLYEAIVALKEAQKKFSARNNIHAHRAVLVKNKNGKIIGKISQMDAIQALEPEAEPTISKAAKRFGFSKNFILGIQAKYNFWDIQIDHIPNRAKMIAVKDAMYAPVSGMYVGADDSLSRAVHLLAAGDHHSLLVVEKKNSVIGILRLTDVFSALFDGCSK